MNLITITLPPLALALEKPWTCVKVEFAKDAGRLRFRRYGCLDTIPHAITQGVTERRTELCAGSLGNRAGQMTSSDRSPSTARTGEKGTRRYYRGDRNGPMEGCIGVILQPVR